MDIASYLQSFESRLSSYEGDDPLDPWIKFVDFLEQRLPAGDTSEMCLVFDSLVQRFLNNERYSNDIRYVNYCIRCASYYWDPIAFYKEVFGKGVGTRTAALYVAWAREFERRGMKEQADAVYRKALENQAQPASTVLHEYSQFNARTTVQPLATGVQNPLQNLTNQMSCSKEPVEPSKMTWDCPSKPPAPRMTIIVSRSEASGSLSSQSSSDQTVSEYFKDELLCDGSELSFEEVRAKKYFQKLQQKKREEENKLMERQLQEQEERIRRMKLSLEEAEDMEACGGLTEQISHQDGFYWSLPKPGSGSAGPECVTETPVALLQTSVTENGLSSSLWAADADADAPAQHSASRCDGGHPAESEEKLDVSQGGAANLSHTTPNSSLGFVQATPSRVLPSPTVNTREALGVVMGMFQAPTFVEEPVSDSSHLNNSERDLEDGASGGGPVWSRLPEVAPFTIFQDHEEDKENVYLAEASADRKAVRCLAEVAPKADKPNETSQYLMPDESTMWGARFNPLNSLAACPNNTSEFALLAHCVSTPFTHKPLSSFSEDQENICSEDDASIRRQTKRLSPIIEQSPNEDQALETAASLLEPSSVRQGTIVSTGLDSTSITMLQPPPPVVLSFREQTPAPADSSGRSGRGWEVHASPEPPLQLACLGSVKPKTRPFRILEDASSSSGDLTQVPMSQECALQPGQFSARSPEAPAEPDLDAFLSPLRPVAPTKAADIPMSPEQLPLCADVPMSPQQSLVSTGDQPMMGPDRELRPHAAGGVHVVPDPWDNQLISHLLSRLSPPLTSHQRCFAWSCNVPNISPKVTISMGKTSLRVDCVLGEGAFATVYQATDLATSEKFILKVQKPANPWEFYINTQLDARLPPSMRPLYSNISSAHLFLNGSVLLGEFYSCGTLLNAVNIYKSLGEKGMPPPLVLYFAACILHTVEQLHRLRLIHADIKPDNFMLGGRFLENRCFDPESGDHGIVLIDLGQSIDMELFPEGTAFTARCLTSGFQCTEMQSGKPWNYQTDYYGIAGTVHCMLFGNYMQVTNENGVWKTNGVFRRKPHGDLWLDVFHALLNVPDCESPQSLARLRLQLTAVLQENYSSKLQALKNHLVIQLLERRRPSCR